MLGGCEDELDEFEIRPLHLWWLVLFIVAWSSPKILSGKGANNGQFERGQLVQVILTKAVFACKRLWW